MVAITTVALVVVSKYQLYVRALIPHCDFSVSDQSKAGTER